MLRFALPLLLAVAGCHFTPSQSRGCATARVAVDGGTLVEDTLTDGGPCIAPPTLFAARLACDGTNTHCASGGAQPPALACLDVARTDGGVIIPPPHPATPARVTVSGFVRALESGADTSDISVQLIDPTLLATGANPAFVQSLGAATTTLDGSITCDAKHACRAADAACIDGACWSKSGGAEPLQRACDTDLSLGCTFALADGCNHSCNDGLYGREDDGKYCRDDGSGGTCRDRLRWEPRYAIANIPTNRALVARITGAGGASNTSWTQIVRWSLFFASDARACINDGDTDCLDVTSDPTTPTYRLDFYTVAQSDYRRIAVASGLSGSVPNGEGAILGEVQDCDGVRIGNVSIAVEPEAARISYFADDPLVWRPDVTRALAGTDPLGRFSAWGIHGGRATVDTAGIISGSTYDFGRSDIFVYGNTLSVVTINGGLR
jgi:hypothetical protein